LFNNKGSKKNKKLKKAEASFTKFRFKPIYDNLVHIIIAYGTAKYMGKA